MFCVYNFRYNREIPDSEFAKLKVLSLLEESSAMKDLSSGVIHNLRLIGFLVPTLKGYHHHGVWQFVVFLLGDDSHGSRTPTVGLQSYCIIHTSDHSSCQSREKVVYKHGSTWQGNTSGINHPRRVSALMSDNKTGPVFFHPASETKDFSGFWGGGPGLVSADLNWEKPLNWTPLSRLNVLCTTAGPGWMVEGWDGWLPLKRGGHCPSEVAQLRRQQQC